MLQDVLSNVIVSCKHGQMLSSVQMNINAIWNECLKGTSP